eukprot:2762912-Prymnesium_polylepis.1
MGVARGGAARHGGGMCVRQHDGSRWRPRTPSCRRNGPSPRRTPLAPTRDAAGGTRGRLARTCRASAWSPDTHMPECLSTLRILRLEPSTSILERIGFSIPIATPSLHRMPTAVLLLSTALTAYSTWKTRPSGEKVVVD